MEILDKAHTETFGHPVPAKVRLHARKGKAILVSGHDLHDLYALLEQTKGLASKSTLMAKCCLRTVIQSSKAYEHLAAITAEHGTDRPANRGIRVLLNNASGCPNVTRRFVRPLACLSMLAVIAGEMS